METTTCARCKTENASNQKYCKGCGFTLPNALIQKPASKFPLLRPNRERAKAAMYGMGMMLALMIPALLIQGLWARIIFLIVYADHVPVAALTAGILAQFALVLLLLIVSIFSLILFLMWFRRAYYNLRLIKGKTRYATGWAVGGWFIPVVFFFLPYLIMRELFRDTKRALLEAYPDCGKQLPKKLVGWWWAVMWSPLIYTTIISLSLYIPIPLILINISSISSLICNIIFPLLTIKLIYDYAKMEKMLTQ